MLGAGIFAYASGSAITRLSGGGASIAPIAAHAGWMGFYVAAYLAILVLLRARAAPVRRLVRPRRPDRRPDGRCAARRARDPDRLDGISTGDIVAGFVYPCADIVLLALVLWASSMTGWRGGRMWLWLSGAFALAGIGDIALNLSVLAGDYDTNSLLTVCFPLAMVALAIAAHQPPASVRALRTDALSVLVLPGVCVVAARFEALARWERAEMGTVGPAEFIDLAEQSGLIVDLGRWVLRTACTQVMAWHELQPPAEPAFSISVNVSPRQLRHPLRRGRARRWPTSA